MAVGEGREDGTVTIVPGRRAAAHRRTTGLVWVTALLTATAVCALVVVAVGSIARVPVSGQPALDVRVSWLLPAARLVTDVAAGVTVGCLVAAAVLLPGKGTVSVAAYRWLRVSTWSALAWALALAAAVPGLLIEFLNTDLTQVSAPGLLAFVRDIPAGRAQAASVLLVAAVAVGSRWVLTTAGAWILLVLTLLAVVSPSIAEFAEAGGTTVQVAAAATAMVLHVIGALTWFGALVALLLVRLDQNDLVTAVRRYSRAAPALVVVVATSGLLTATVELGTSRAWVGTAFGRLVLLKVLALAALVALGWWHRRGTLPALATGHAGAFRRIVAVELVLFAATIGLAVGLSRTPAPQVAAETGDVAAAADASSAVGWQRGYEWTSFLTTGLDAAAPCIRTSEPGRRSGHPIGA